MTWRVVGGGTCDGVGGRKEGSIGDVAGGRVVVLPMNC